MANINCYRNSRKQLGFLKGSSFLYHFFHLGYFFPPTFNCAGTPAYKWSLSFRVPSSNSRHMPTSVCYSVFLVEKANILIVKQRLFRFHYILFFFPQVICIMGFIWLHSQLQPAVLVTFSGRILGQYGASFSGGLVGGRGENTGLFNFYLLSTHFR